MKRTVARAIKVLAWFCLLAGLAGFTAGSVGMVYYGWRSHPALGVILLMVELLVLTAVLNDYWFFGARRVEPKARSNAAANECAAAAQLATETSRTLRLLRERGLWQELNYFGRNGRVLYSRLIAVIDALLRAGMTPDGVAIWLTRPRDTLGGLPYLVYLILYRPGGKTKTLEVRQ